MSEQDRTRPSGTNDPPSAGKHCNGCRFDGPHPTYDRFCERFKTQLVAAGPETLRNNFCTHGDPLDTHLDDGASITVESTGAGFTQVKRCGNTFTVKFNGQLKATFTI